MPKSTVARTIDAEIEASWEAGIVFALVTHCRIASAEAVKLAKDLAGRSSTLPERKRAARERIAGALLSASVDVAGERGREKQERFW